MEATAAPTPSVNPWHPGTCDVCQRGDRDVAVASSCLGAMSLAFCQECLGQNAESEGMFLFTASMCGDQVADFVKQLTTFKDGTYIGYLDWYALPGIAEQARAAMAEYEQACESEHAPDT